MGITTVVLLLLLLGTILRDILSAASLRDASSSPTTSVSTHHSLPHHFLEEDVNVAWYDVVVVGAGPAGLTAALFCGRAGLRTLVAGSTTTGQLSESLLLHNFPSFRGGQNSSSDGELWLQQTKQQVMEQSGASDDSEDDTVEFLQAGLRIESLKHYSYYHNHQQQQQQQHLFELPISSSSLTLASRAVIVATGASPRKLGLPREMELWGKSVHSCAICDGSSYHHKTVVVVGGGDAAVDATLLLTRQQNPNHVILIHRQTTFRASNRKNVEQVVASDRVELRTPFVLKEYEVDSQNRLAAVRIQHIHNTSETQRVPCDGVFLMIGSTPNTEWLRGTLELDKDGLIVLENAHSAVPGTTKSTVDGVFAAGEVTDSLYRQAITAAAAGAQAAIDTQRWLQTQPSPEIKKNSNKSGGKLPLEKSDRSDDKKAAVATDGRGKEKQHASYDCDLAKQDCIRLLVLKYPVVVFSKPACSFCRKALEALAAEGVSGAAYLHVVHLTAFEESTMGMIQDNLLKMTGRRTVPNVFVHGHSIGGGDDTVALHKSGKLRKLLLEAKAFPSVNDDCDLSSPDCVSKLVQHHPVVVFSKSYCPYCRRALEALRAEGISQAPYLRVVDLTARSDGGAAVQDTLQEMTGRRTVPNVFIGGRSVGGGDETSSLHREGKLGALLKEAKAFG